MRKVHSTPSSNPTPAVEDSRSGGDRREPTRSESSTATAPDPEVIADRAKRRTFTAEYKKQILDEADACTEPGQIGALVRREGLYSSHLTEWRRLRDAGALAGLGRTRGRKVKPIDALATKVAELERENRRLADRLRKAETIIDVQKKVSQLLGVPMTNEEPSESNS